ncbi:MAG: sugar ABC transporter substrate-binding protein [Firmicutes bacterium]|nr:sugar ABC transporter substrate-binding protein [Bacillota bacterium]
MQCRWQRVATAVGAFALTAGVLAGCGGGASNTPQQSNAPTGSKTGGETITFWADVEAPLNQQKQIWQPVLDQFEQQTGIHVNYQAIGWDSLLNQITTQITSGASDVDVVGIGNTWASSLAATNGLLPLTPDRLQQIGGKEKFVPAAFGLTGLPGQDPVAVPYISEAMGLFYNKEMFQQAGISDPPKTWDEFLADAKKLTDPAKKQYGVVLDTGDTSDMAHLFFVLLSQKGGSFFADQAGKRPTLTTSQAHEAAKFIGDLFTQKVISPGSAEYNSADEMNNAFINGEGAMMISQNNSMATLDNSPMKGKYGVAPVPIFSGGQNVTSHVAGIDLAIFKNSQHQQAALQFLKFVTDKEAQVELNKGFHQFPANKEALNDPAFSQGNLAVFKQVLLTSAKPTPQVPTYTQVETDVGSAIKAIASAAATGQNYGDALIDQQLKTANDDIAALSATP